ncbi:MAG: hypothetical protein ACI9WU_000654 [Myxococcota bacterium]|jgi:hypothetical protein
MKSLSTAILTAALLVASSASAATIYVADSSCTGEPTPCTTDLQDALDDTRFDVVHLLTGSIIYGDYQITRALTFEAGASAGLRPSGTELSVLHVEDTSNVTIDGLIFQGRVNVDNSSTVLLRDCSVDTSHVSVHVVDSTVTLLDTTVDATDRAIEALDSTVTIDGCDLDATDYAVVANGSSITVDGGTAHGDDNAFVLQDGSGATGTSLTATDAALTANGSNDTTWMWYRATTSYTNCTPTPSNDVDSPASLVTWTGFVPWGGE